MKAVILAAGKGSRLKQLTINTPKSLLEIKPGFTLLKYNIDILTKMNVDEILIVTGFENKQLENEALSYGYKNIRFIYNPFWNLCNVLGSFYFALPLIDDDFFFLHADTLAEIDIWKDLRESEGDIVLPIDRKKCGEEEMKVLVDKNGGLLEISKEIDGEKADGEFLGIAKFKKGTIPFLINTAKELFSGGELNQYMEAAVQKAIGTHIKIETLDIGNSKFVEVDFEEDYKQAQVLFG